DLWKRTRRLRMAATVATVVLPNFVPILARAYTAEASTPWTSPLPADLNRPTRLITNHRLSQLGQAAAGVAALDNCYAWHLRATTDPTLLERVTTGRVFDVDAPDLSWPGVSGSDAVALRGALRLVQHAPELGPAFVLPAACGGVPTCPAARNQ